MGRDELDWNEVLKSDCTKCLGFCCRDLYFSKMDGFPYDKATGIPCLHLDTAYRCRIHAQLQKKGCTGCLSYECFGAGQHCASLYKNSSQEIQDQSHVATAFYQLHQLHEMLWYLREAYTHLKTNEERQTVQQLMQETYALCEQPLDTLLHRTLDKHRDRVNQHLRAVSDELRKGEEISGKKRWKYIQADLSHRHLQKLDLRGACMIEANLKGSTLTNCDMIAADLRNADLRDADLSSCLYLTQMQINGARGNRHTKLPEFLYHPSHWEAM